MAIMPMTEFDRFMRMFDRMFDFVETYIHKTPDDKYEWIPLDGPGVSFGDRLENITIKGLYVHLTTSEDGFVRSLLSVEDGEKFHCQSMKSLPIQFMTVILSQWVVKFMKIAWKCLRS